MEEILVNLISDEGSEYKKNYYSSRKQMTHLNMAKDLNFENRGEKCSRHRQLQELNALEIV